MPCVSNNGCPNLEATFIVLSSYSTVSLISAITMGRLLTFGDCQTVFGNILIKFVIVIIIAPVFGLVDSSLNPLLDVIVKCLIVTLLVV